MNGLQAGMFIVGVILAIALLILIIALIRLADALRRAVPEFESTARNANQAIKESKQVIKDFETAIQSSQKILENSVQITLKTDRFLENALPKANILMDDIQSKSNRLETSVSEIARISERISQINDNIDKFVLPLINNFSGLADRFQEYIQKYSEKKVKKENNEYEMDYHIERKVEDE